MANIGFSKLTQIAKIKLILHLLEKSNPKDRWRINFDSNFMGSIGYFYGGFQSVYSFSNEKERKGRKRWIH